jgi:phosphatidylglycerol:prolipoprotein diacylglycerol transferase
VIYGLAILTGLVLAALMARLIPEDRPDLAPHRAALARAAVVGAILGAFLGEVPADLLGWSRRPPGLPTDLMPLGGRTVLGGLLGGWLAVEVVKWRRGLSGPTGDRLAAPLATALACGRLGCAGAGCCAGVPAPDGAWWAWQGCWPVPFIESGFHAVAAVLLLLAARRRWWSGRHLGLYLTVYGVLRFHLEWVRGNPPVLGPLTWYQLLALALVALAGGTTLVRWRRRIPLNT